MIVEDSIECHIDAYTKSVGIAAKFSNVLHTVAGCRTGAKAGGTQIHGIRTVVHGGLSAGEVAGRG